MKRYKQIVPGYQKKKKKKKTKTAIEEKGTGVSWYIWLNTSERGQVLKETESNTHSRRKLE